MSYRRLTREELAQWQEQVMGEKIPGCPDQHMMEESLTPRFYVGTRRRFGNWTCHYAYAGAAMALAGRGAVEHNTPITGAIPPVATPAGSYTVTITDAVSVVNAYKNGYMVFFPIAGTMEQHRIKSSTATVGGLVQLTLFEPTIAPITAAGAEWIDSYYSQYADVRNPAGGDLTWTSFVGVNITPVTALSYFWLVTYGSVFVTWNGAGVEPGAAANERECYFAQNGTLLSGSTVFAGAVAYQRAGYVIPSTAPAGGGMEQIMLQLDP